MDEACQLDGEFKEWRVENRNARVWQMASVIDRSSGCLKSLRESIFRRIGKDD